MSALPATAAGGVRKRPSVLGTRRWVAAVFLLPALVLLGALVVYPIAFSVYRSLFDASGNGFVGLGNYGAMFSDDTIRTALKNNVIVSSERGTSLIDIRYRSRDPKTAAAIVARIVSEYTIFVNNTKHGSVLEALQKLTQAKEDNIRKLEEKDYEYLELRRQSGGFLDADGKQVNLVGLRLLELNKELVEAQRMTLEAWAFQQAVRNAMAS